MGMTMTYGREAMGELGPEDFFLSSHFKTLIHMCKLKGAPVPGPTNARHWDKKELVLCLDFLKVFKVFVLEAHVRDGINYF